MADIEKLDGLLSAALPGRYGGVSVIGSDLVKANYIIRWLADPSAADLTTSATILAAFDPTIEAALVTQRKALETAALSLDGVAVNAMTAIQVRTLIALLAYKQGWVKADGTLKVR